MPLIPATIIGQSWLTPGKAMGRAEATSVQQRSLAGNANPEPGSRQTVTPRPAALISMESDDCRNTVEGGKVIAPLRVASSHLSFDARERHEQFSLPLPVVEKAGGGVARSRTLISKRSTFSAAASSAQMFRRWAKGQLGGEDQSEEGFFDQPASPRLQERLADVLDLVVRRSE